MTTLLVPPITGPTAGLDSLELEITGKCQLACKHCLTQSSPQAEQGDMTYADWREVLIDAARLGIPQVQLIGGEPTTHPQWIALAELALSLNLRVEVYSNMWKVLPHYWPVFLREGVTIGTSYYSDDPAEHDEITTRPGSYVATRTNIREAVRRGVTVRAGIVDVLPGQRVAEARAELLSMGVTRINVDRVRAVGRAAETSGCAPTLDEMCGRCTQGRAAVLPNGDLAGCVLSRDFPAGNVREARLFKLLNGPKWAALSNHFRAVRPTACASQDSSDCDPASTTACDPAY
ncbi:radical SAM protein [Streptomyces virginiae]|uniref:radical SAM protein n=1 Tax=Streptomyces virginiae TaxID=1961 RepID=UPI003693F220